ncbi:cysteine desulfurase [Candidatus Woesearchaeota archaeon]|nr:cysteine desulfurase [Candidatus Woesearchaeota archaeon]
MDNAATTPLDPKVTKAMLPFFEEKFGNASSSHQLGRQAKEALEKARSVIAKSIDAKPEEIFFTSGGTESNNFAIKSAAFTNRSKGNHIITTKIEHECVLNSCKWLEKQGFKVTYLDVDEEGFIDLKALEEAMTSHTILVSVIHGNNEVGTIQDLADIGRICREHKVLLHTDACQSYCKTDLSARDADLITLNAHKIHGPKGVGALYVKEGTNILAWQSGGGHEYGLRSGTENIPGIVGFAECVKQAIPKKHRAYMKKLRDKLIYGILQIEGAKLNGPTGNKRLCNNTNFVFEGLVGETIGGYLDQKGICSSTASACTVHTNEPSHVLQAMGLTKEQAEGGLRLTISRFTTEDEVNKVLKELPGIIHKIKMFG